MADAQFQKIYVFPDFVDINRAKRIFPGTCFSLGIKNDLGQGLKLNLIWHTPNLSSFLQASNSNSSISTEVYKILKSGGL